MSKEKALTDLLINLHQNSTNSDTVLMQAFKDTLDIVEIRISGISPAVLNIFKKHKFFLVNIMSASIQKGLFVTLRFEKELEVD